MKRIYPTTSKKRRLESTPPNEQLSEIILSVLAIVGMVALAVLAPNIIMLLDRRRRRQLSPHDVRRSINGLQKRGLVSQQRRGGTYTVQITAEGQLFLKKRRIFRPHIIDDSRWDRKWRLVFFDIPAVRGPIRHHIRRLLRAAGLCPVQRSIYVAPFDCYYLVKELRTRFDLHTSIHYAVVEKMTDSSKYRRHFHLS